MTRHVAQQVRILSPEFHPNTKYVAIYISVLLMLEYLISSFNEHVELFDILWIF